MKVLMVSKALVVGAYHGKLAEMARLGVDLTVIVPQRWGKQIPEIPRADEYKIHIVPCMFSGHNHLHFYLRAVDEADADIVHIDEEPWSLVTFQFTRWAKKRKIRAVFFTWQNIYKNYPAPFRFIEADTLRYADAAIAGNQSASEILRTKRFVKPVSIIPQFGVDPVLFASRDVSHLRRELDLDGRFVIGYVGRIQEEKGVNDLVRALAALPHCCVLVIVGDGSFRLAVERLSHQLNVVSRIRWVPHISSLLVPDYVNLLDVLVLPSRTTSRWKEQFGRVLVEAMACEIPVIGSSSGEIPNVIGDGGLVFPEGDVVALTQHLQYLWEDGELGRRIGKTGRNRVLNKFTHRRIAQDTVRVYQEILARPHTDSAQHQAPARFV